MHFTIIGGGAFGDDGYLFENRLPNSYKCRRSCRGKGHEATGALPVLAAKGRLPIRLLVLE